MIDGRGASCAPPIRRTLPAVRPAAILATVLALVACSGTGAPTSTDAAERLAAAADALAATPSFEVTITRDGPPLTVDALPGLGVEAVSGVFVAPDRAQGAATARLGPLAATVDFVAIGDTVWLAVPLVGWEELTATDTIDIPSILGPEGLTLFVAEDVTDVVFEELEEGPAAYRGTFDTTRLSAVSAGVIGAGVTAVRGTVAADGRLATVVFADPAQIDLTWLFGFSGPGSGDDLEIVPPT